jgi:hypothetical protein
MDKAIAAANAGASRFEASANYMPSRTTRWSRRVPSG